MRVHSFDLEGKQAHFRKYYANNTALSFTLPPRTTLMGIVGAVLGRARDSYYWEFGPEQVRFGVGLLSPVKKTFHRLNLLKILGDSDFRGRQGRIQTPFELVVPLDPRQGKIVYRIYVTSNNNLLMDELGAFLENRRSFFNPSLGLANFNASLKRPRLDLGIEKVIPSDDYIELKSAVLSDQVKALHLDHNKKVKVEEELTPAAFVADFDRELASMQRIIYTTDGDHLRVKLNASCLKVTDSEAIEYFAFLD